MLQKEALLRCLSTRKSWIGPGSWVLQSEGTAPGFFQAKTLDLLLTMN